MHSQLKLRPLERDDLIFVHVLDNNESVMHYWFEEAYEAYVELCDLYDKHIPSIRERAMPRWPRRLPWIMPLRCSIFTSCR